MGGIFKAIPHELAAQKIGCSPQTHLCGVALRKAGEVKGEKPLSPFANGEISCRRAQAAKFYFTIFTRNDGSAVSSSERADEPNKRISLPLSISLMGTGCVIQGLCTGVCRDKADVQGIGV